MSSDHKCLVNQCCCGCTLRTGSLIIGIIYVIANLANCAYVAYVAIAYHAPVLWVTFTIGIIYIIVSCILINGIRQESARQVWLWVWVTGICLIIFAIMMIVNFVSSYNWGYLISNIIAILIIVYFIVVVRSFAIQLQTGGGSAA